MRCAGKRCDDLAVAVVDRGTVQELACARCANGILLFGTGRARVRLLRAARRPACVGA